MAATDLTIQCADGLDLRATVYSTELPLEGALVIGSALGVPRKIYRLFAEFLNLHGYSVLTFDYRDSVPKNSGVGLSVSQWGSQDLNAAFDHMLSLADGKPVFHLGHSIGGQVAGLAENLPNIKGMIFVASSFPYWKRWPMPQRISMAVMFKLLVPIIARLTQSFPSRAIGLSSENLPSPLVAEWSRWMGKDDYLLDAEFGLDKQGYQTRTGPLLAFGFADDTLVPQASFDKILAAYPNTEIQRRWVDTSETGPIGHMGFFKEKHRHGLWQKCLEWLQAHR
ncbi:MAG: alpha/beta hydrolase family protein [Cellvibrionaceae bacterium]